MPGKTASPLFPTTAARRLHSVKPFSVLIAAAAGDPTGGRPQPQRPVARSPAAIGTSRANRDKRVTRVDRQSFLSFFPPPSADFLIQRVATRLSFLV